jgi:4-hydroxy-tetrahydrodipicolinate reductase
MTRTSITIVGAAGRMGRSLLEVADGLDDVGIVGAVEHADHDELGERIGPRAIEVVDQLEAALESADVAIDFSSPEGCVEAAEACYRQGTPLVSGTTGLSDPQRASVDETTDGIAVLRASNFSIGINLLMQLVETASEATNGQFDIEISESHHRHKVDAPSGTALSLGEAAAEARDLDLDEVAVWGRHGEVGERSDDEIGFQVRRGGSIVGEHEVALCGPGERIELSHRAGDRNIFAQGALQAAIWLEGRDVGRYSMRDVLFGSTP